MKDLFREFTNDLISRANEYSKLSKELKKIKIIQLKKKNLYKDFLVWFLEDSAMQEKK